MDIANVTARLSFVSTDGRVFAELVYANTGERPASLLGFNAALGNELENDLFELTDDRGNKLCYTGPLVKRAEPRAEDFVRLAAGAQATGRVPLDGAYAFPRGAPRDYRAIYAAYHPYPDRPGFWKLVSNEAGFRR